MKKHQLDFMAKYGDADYTHELVIHPDVKTETLKDVAKNPSLHRHTIDTLLDHRDQWVKSAVARNPKINDDDMKYLLKSHVPNLQGALNKKPQSDEVVHAVLDANKKNEDSRITLMHGISDKVWEARKDDVHPSFYQNAKLTDKQVTHATEHHDSQISHNDRLTSKQVMYRLNQGKKVSDSNADAFLKEKKFPQLPEESKMHLRLDNHHEHPQGTLHQYMNLTPAQKKKAAGTFHVSFEYPRQDTLVHVLTHGDPTLHNALAQSRNMNDGIAHMTLYSPHLNTKSLSRLAGLPIKRSAHDFSFYDPSHEVRVSAMMHKNMDKETAKKILEEPKNQQSRYYGQMQRIAEKLKK